MPSANLLKTMKPLLALALGALLSPWAQAHVFPQSQTPGAGAEVAAPASVKIEFDGPLEPAFSSLSVSDAGGKVVSAAHSQVDPNDKKLISVALPSLAPGKYTVHWAAVASDSHRTQGDYSFTVK